MKFDLQPVLENNRAILHPLNESDFNALYLVASDPAIWTQHPSRNRYQKDVFQIFFEGAIKSRGAFKIISKQSGQIIGSTRFYDHDEEDSSVFIGYTFYAVEAWGKGINHAVKETMINYAFGFVQKVKFQIGAKNMRSQVAIGRLGAVKIGEEQIAYFGENSNLNYIFQVDKESWSKRPR